MASLHFRWAPMNASKTAQLLMIAYNYEQNGSDVICFKPRIDDRTGEHIISRALGVKRKAILLDSNDEVVIEAMVSNKMPSCVLVDEAQFLTGRQVEVLSEIVYKYNIPVICFGLKTDFQGHLFEGSKRLLELAQECHELQTKNICGHCGRKATMNMRLLDGKAVFHGEQIQTGFEESYQPVCLERFNQLREEYNKNETTKAIL